MLRLLVLATSALGVLWVVLLGGLLPDVVASHFDLSGRADGHLPRPVFVALMAVLVGGVPLLTWWLQQRAIDSGRPRIPNAEFWLSAKHRQATFDWLRFHAAVFAIATTVFLAALHALVVLANRGPRLELPGGAFWAMLLLYLAFVAAWTLRQQRRFGRG